MKTKYVIGLLFVLMFIVSCEDFLREEPPTFISSANFWKTSTDARTATDAVYQTLFDGGGSSVYGRYWQAVDLATDDATSRTGVNNYSDWFSHTIYPSHSWFESWQSYQKLWKGIGRANDVIAFVPGIDMDETDKKALIGEAKALRALNYLHLVKTWGDMPLIVNTIEGEADFNLTRSSVNDIYDQIIIPDLKYAEQNCKDELHTGRITKWTAKVILADVYMTYAGWRRTSQGEFVQGDAANWTLARDKSKEIIDNSPHSLLTEAYVDGAHTTPAYGVPWLESQPYSVESMMELGAVNVDQYGSWLSRAAGSYAWGRYYWGEQGDDQPLLSEGNEGRLGDKDGLRFQNLPTSGKFIPVPDLYASFEDGDERRNWGIMTRYDTPEGDTYLCQPVFRKYVDIDFYLGAPDTNFKNTNNNVIMYRYADALLIYAEAQNEADGSPNIDAYAAINEIRNRAGLGDLTPGLSQDNFRKAVWLERRHELHAEVKRRFDLIRTNRLKTETANIKMQWTAAEGSAVDYYQRNILMTGTVVWPDHEWLFPIPQTEMNLNEKNGWEQNQGYE